MPEKKTIKVAVVGVGNCAKSLIEGVKFYSDRDADHSQGMMRSDIGGYHASDIEFVAAFDIDERKIGLPLNVAINQRPNCAWKIVDDCGFTCIVNAAPVIDGYAGHMDHFPEEDRFLVSEELRNTTDVNRVTWSAKKDREWKDKVIQVLNESGAEMIINYLPVGSQAATEFWAEVCLETGLSFINCIPVFIASDPAWEQKFKDAGIPLIGDDMRSQFGASILSQMLEELALDRGHKVLCHVQRNIGGNTDFLNMNDKTRLKSKKISKENVLNAQSELRGLDPKTSFRHAGPSEYIKYYGDNKVANFRVELEGFGGAPVILDAQLSVQDSPNSGGVVIDAIRYLKVATQMGIVGALRGPSAFTQKTPPEQMRFADAMHECEELSNRRLTLITSKQVPKKR